MTAAYMEPNATLGRGQRPVLTPADDPSTKSWRGAKGVSREQLLEASRRKLNRLVLLPVGWDGHRGRPPAPTAVVVLNGVLEELVTDDGPTPQIAPLADGGVEVAWLVGGESLSVDVSVRGVVQLLAEAPTGETYFEGGFDYWQADGFLLGQARTFLEKISHDVEVRVARA